MGSRVFLGDIATLHYGKMPNKALLGTGIYDAFSGYQTVGKYPLWNTPANTLIVVARGVGGTGDVKYVSEPVFLTNLSIAIELEDELLSKYLFWKYKQDGFNWLRSGSAQPQITIGDLEKVEIEFPSNSAMAKTVLFCEALQSKINLNRQANDYLEQVCQSLFDEFDSDETNPFVAISDIADVNPKRTIKKGEEALCVEMSDLSTSGSFPSDWKMKPYNGGMKFVNGDTIMARITPCLENGKTGYINFLADNQTAFGSTEYIVMATKGILPPEYFYFLARNREFVAYAVAHMNGSSGRQRVSGADIERYEVRMPNAEQLERFRRVTGSAMKMILANSLENRKLTELRDTLLPRLMSGEIDVLQIELPAQPNNHLL